MKCFIDTNSLIHFRLFSEIDWKKVLAVQNVEIVVCPAVLQELDRKKFSELDIDIRNRCKKIISKLSEYHSGAVIKENIAIIFLNKEPKIDWLTEGLSPDIPDDRIIASIIEDSNWEDVVLISSDLGLKLKAQSRNIKTQSLSDDLLVQVKKDKKDEELAKLRGRLSFLENRFPKLIIKIVDNDSFSTFKKFSFDNIKPYDSTITNKVINELNAKLKYVPKVETNLNKYANFIYAPSDQFSIPSKEEIFRYENDLEKYISKMKDYYKDEWEYNDKISRIFEVNLLLINEGSEPAEDIDIFLHFPDGFIVFGKDKYPHQPKKPEEPDKARSLSEMIMNIDTGITIPSHLLKQTYYPTHLPIMPKGTNTSPKIKKTNSYDVRFNIDKLKHKMNIKLDPLYIYFENYESIKSFSFEYAILASNNPEEFQGELNLVFS